MKLTFLGAARTVTGSCHLLEAAGKRLLLDCGLRQGKRKQSFEANRKFEFSPSSIDAVVLSHAHIDHSGNLPRLCASGFAGPVYSTAATADLCGWMLRDSAHIQEMDISYVNKRRRRRGQRPFEPLYRKADAEKALTQFRGLPYDEPTQLFPGVDLRFEDAGHILGSASCHIEIEEHGEPRKLVFTGDVGRSERPIIRDPVPPRDADVLICESTYGDRLHEADEDVRTRLLEVVRDTFRQGGKVLIPAFSVGRTQHLIYHLHCLVESGDLPPVPIFVDSPLAANVTNVYRAHPECYDAETRELLTHKSDAFGFERLTYVRDVAASKALVTLRAPAIIIAASGMCEAGRVVHHLKTVAPDKRSTVLVVGYMAPHTLGRRIVERVQTLRLFGVEHDLAARVETVGGLSGHGDRDELIAYLSHLRSPPERTFLVHGDEKPAESLASALREQGYPAVDVPRPGDSFEV